MVSQIAKAKDVKVVFNSSQIPGEISRSAGHSHRHLEQQEARGRSLQRQLQVHGTKR